MENQNFNPSERIKIIDYKGKKIFSEDYSYCSPNDSMQILKQSSRYIQKQPLNSVLNLANVTGTKYNADSIEYLKKYSGEDKAYIKKTAVLGIEGMKKVSLKTVSLFSNRSFRVFNNKEEAKEWLISDK